MNSKERAQYRSQAQNLDAIIQIGKDGITNESVITANQALYARELIKLSVQENCPLSAREAADILSERTDAEVIQVIGRKFVLYKKSDKKNRK